MADLKPINTRTAEVLEATKKLFELGITKQAYPELDGFFRDLNTFLKGSDYSITGRVKLQGLNRTLAYNLCVTASIPCTIALLNNQ